MRGVEAIELEEIERAAQPSIEVPSDAAHTARRTSGLVFREPKSGLVNASDINMFAQKCKQQQLVKQRGLPRAGMLAHP